MTAPQRHASASSSAPGASAPPIPPEDHTAAVLWLRSLAQTHGRELRAWPAAARKAARAAPQEARRESGVPALHPQDPDGKAARAGRELARHYARFDLDAVDDAELRREIEHVDPRDARTMGEVSGLAMHERAVADWLRRMHDRAERRYEKWSGPALQVAAGMSERALELAGLPDLPRRAAELRAPGGRGGEAPTPYAHYGHLRRESRQGHGRESEAGPEGHESARPVQDGAPTANDTHAFASHLALHAAAGRPEWGGDDLLHQARLSERARVPRGLGSEHDWVEYEDRWIRERALRRAVEVATGHRIMDRFGNPEPCWESGQLKQHEELHGEFQFRAHTCKQRERCPHCGHSYGQDAGRTLWSLMDAAHERARIKEGEALGWGIVWTFPKEISRYLGELADQRRYAELRKEVARAVELTKRYIARLLLGTRADSEKERRQIGAAINVHWWSSRNPTNGYHWHLHILVPNCRKDGRKLRRRAMIEPSTIDGEEVDWLTEARLELEDGIISRWGEHLSERRMKAERGSRGIANADVRWYLNVDDSGTNANVAGRQAWAHRCRYDARHPWSDVLKLAGVAPHLLFADDALERVRTVAERIENLRGGNLRTSRYVGWIVPGQRKNHEIFPVEASDPWVDVEGGFVQVSRFSARGLIGYRRAITLEELEGCGQWVEIEIPASTVTAESYGAKRWECRRRPPAHGGATDGVNDDNDAKGA